MKYTTKLLLLFCFLLSLKAQALNLTFSYWPYDQEGCNNIRDQYLQQNTVRSNEADTPGSYAFDGCHVQKGRWKDSFTDEVITNASDAIVASIIPMDFLKPYAKLISFQRLHSYAHDQSLFVILKKGGEGEKLYKANSKTLVSFPKRINARCEIIGQWMDAKSRWNFPMSSEEKANLVKEAVICQSGDEYNRLETFGGWTTNVGFKCNTRVEVLRRDSAVETTPEDGETRPCTPRLIGKWNDLYTGQTYTDAHDLDIDHVVPLKHAYISGAWKWASQKKREYANFLTNSEHLIAVDASANRSKGDAPPQLWMPPNLKFHCAYLTRWVSIKFRWGLSVDDVEKSYLTEQLKGCPKIDYKKQVEIITLLNASRLE